MTSLQDPNQARAIAYAIRVRLPDMKKAQLLAPSGCLVRLRIYAAMIRDRAYAEQVAAEIRDQHPDAVVTVAPL